jgi:hypothetical protein
MTRNLVTRSLQFLSKLLQLQLLYYCRQLNFAASSFYRHLGAQYEKKKAEEKLKD